MSERQSQHCLFQLFDRDDGAMDDDRLGKYEIPLISFHYSKRVFLLILLGAGKWSISFGLGLGVTDETVVFFKFLASCW